MFDLAQQTRKLIQGNITLRSLQAVDLPRYPGEKIQSGTVHISIKDHQDLVERIVMRVYGIDTTKMQYPGYLCLKLASNFYLTRNLLDRERTILRLYLELPNMGKEVALLRDVDINKSWYLLK